MKISLTQGLISVALLVPLLGLVFGRYDWALGCLLGETLGLVSYIWIGLSVRRLLTATSQGARRPLLIHSLGRYLMMGLALFFSVKQPGISVWAVIIGYSIIQLPAAVIRAMATTT